MTKEFNQAQEFPNYFAEIADALAKNKSPAKSYAEVLELIEKNISLILSRLSILHIDLQSGTLKYHSFFNKFESHMQRKKQEWMDKNQEDIEFNLQVHLGGGVVRALLAYVYKELYNNIETAGVKPRVSSAPRSLAKFMQDEIRKPEFHLRRLATQRDEDQLLKGLVLGLTSDLDIYIQVEPRNQKLEKYLIQAGMEFVNSAETANNLSYSRDQFKYLVMPIADVKEINSQLSYSYEQGGSSLDWLSFLLTQQKKQALLRQSTYVKDVDLLVEFIKGFYFYFSGTDEKSQKQLIRALRPLLEIPFLRIKDVEVFQELLKSINFADLDHKAREQIEKLVRNAFYVAANNRAHREDGLLQELARNSLIPIFINKNRITAQRICEGAYAGDLDQYFIPLDEFKHKYCNHQAGQSTLWHGTKDASALLNILRGGFLASIPDKQGVAAFGTGLYTSNMLSTAKLYGNNHYVLPLRIVDNKSIRIIDLAQLYKNSDLLEKLKLEVQDKQCFDVPDLLGKYYNIDIILAKEGLGIFTIQNASVFQTPEIPELINAIVMDMGDNLQNNEWLAEDAVIRSISSISGICAMINMSSLKLSQQSADLISSIREKLLKHFKVKGISFELLESILLIKGINNIFPSDIIVGWLEASNLSLENMSKIMIVAISNKIIPIDILLDFLQKFFRNGGYGLEQYMKYIGMYARPLDYLRIYSTEHTNAILCQLIRMLHQDIDEIALLSNQDGDSIIKAIASIFDLTKLLRNNSSANKDIFEVLDFINNKLFESLQDKQVKVERLESLLKFEHIEQIINRPQILALFKKSLIEQKVSLHDYLTFILDKIDFIVKRYKYLPNNDLYLSILSMAIELYPKYGFEDREYSIRTLIYPH